MSETDKPAETSFLSRWSRRKVEAKDAAQDGAMVPPQPLPGPLSNSSTGAAAGAEVPETPRPEPTLPDTPQPRQELPAIDSLTHEADFSPFMAKDIDPGLRNQAMKKLFTNPHYQFAQMDKLDIYIDDYSQPDPIPLEMLRQMNQAISLGLFDDEEDEVVNAPVAPDTSADLADSAEPRVSTPVSTVDAAGLAPEREAADEVDPERMDVAENNPQEVMGLVGASGTDHGRR